MKKLIFLTALNVGLFTLNCFAQQNKIDSLLTILNTTKEDTTKVNTLNTLFLQYEFTDDEKAKESLNKALALSQKIDYKKGIASTYSNLGFFAEDKGNYPEALKNHFASLKIKEVIGDKKGIANSYNNIGNIYEGQGNYPEALKKYFVSLKIEETIGDKAGIAASYNNIGIIYSNQGNYPEALKKYFASLKIKEEIGNKKGEASSYNSIGNVYETQRNYPEALKNYFASLKIYEAIGDKQGVARSYNNIGSVYYDQGNYPEALKNYLISLKIKEAIGDKAGIAASYDNIGIIYKEQGNYPEALKNLFASLKIRKAIGDKEGVSSSYNGIGIVYIKQKKYKDAEEYLIKAKELSKEIGYKENLRDTYNALTDLNSVKENFKGAYENHKLYILYRDSLDNEETRKRTIQSQMTYDFDKKEAITKLEQDKKEVAHTAQSKQQRLIIYAVIAGLLLVLIFSFFLFRRFRITQKQKKIIELQKQKVDHQKDLIEEKHKEITDSINYAERIQRSFLATKHLLDGNLNSPLRVEASYFVFFQPKDVVSGDFYWASKLSNGRFALVVADSTGHGVPGAIMSILNISSLEKAVEEWKLVEPGEILNHTRLKIIERLKKDGSVDGGKDGMDASLISFDFKNSMLTYAAANNPIWIVRENQILELAPDKMPVGKHDKDTIPFTQHNVNLQKGDVVYALTDGMPDQFGGPKGKKFMYKQLKELLISIAHLPMQEQKEKLRTSLNNWKGNLEQVDDVCLIGVRI